MTTSTRTALMGVNCQPKPVSTLARLGGFIALTRERRQLAELNAHQLADIGVTPQDATTESQKMGWDVPNHWHK